MESGGEMRGFQTEGTANHNVTYVNWKKALRLLHRELGGRVEHMKLGS